MPFLKFSEQLFLYLLEDALKNGIVYQILDLFFRDQHTQPSIFRFRTPCWRDTMRTPCPYCCYSNCTVQGHDIDYANTDKIQFEGLLLY